MASKQQSEVRQVGRFGIVGVLNTLIDFSLYNLLSRSAVARELIFANIFSTTAAMIFSFFANKLFVFKNRQAGGLQAALFFPITAFGLYVIQNGVIYFLTSVWTGPIDFGIAIVHAIGLGSVFSNDFLVKNGAKAAATLASMTWNYLMYKKVVFRNA